MKEGSVDGRCKIPEFQEFQEYGGNKRVSRDQRKNVDTAVLARLEALHRPHSCSDCGGGNIE